MITSVKEFGADFYRLFFPRICGGCGEALAKGEANLCLNCRLELPLTKFELFRNNPVDRLFYGRVPLDFATSFLFFSKGEKVQNILHHIKYNNKQELAVFMGNLFAERVAASEFLKDIGAILPVPLHAKKLALRGYNQSELFAKGLADKLELPLLPGTLKRMVNTPTQTKKSRIERWENVEDVFEVKAPDKIRHKHILLVDDVLTTGSTLEACAQALLAAIDCRVSVATLAYAD
jgi:ComF family protein